jgi:hypothetical protein
VFFVWPVSIFGGKIRQNYVESGNKQAQVQHMNYIRPNV